MIESECNFLPQFIHYDVNGKKYLPLFKPSLPTQYQSPSVNDLHYYIVFHESFITIHNHFNEK